MNKNKKAAVAGRPTREEALEAAAKVVAQIALRVARESEQDEA